jgi:hypothetical protein
MSAICSALSERAARISDTVARSVMSIWLAKVPRRG